MIYEIKLLYFLFLNNFLQDDYEEQLNNKDQLNEAKDNSLEKA